MRILDLVSVYLPAAAPWVFSFALLTAFEMLLPREHHALRGRLAGIVFWAIWLPVMGLTFATFHTLWHWLGIEPILVLPLEFRWAGPLAAVLAPIAGAAVYDFFFYWFHRAQHRWFWRYHAVHHSVRELNAVNAYHHISEPLFQAVFLLLPASLFGTDTGSLAPAMAVLLHLHSSFIHSPTSVHLGPLRAFLCDNRFHRIHHSLEERHFDRNFGAFTTLWDRLFGTAHFPAAEEWPDVGLAAVEQPRGVIAWWKLPYRLRGDDVPAGISAAPANI
jgi:sterol desaturase/sphingolipid hydroxylase (fatty acid hydroxylase superfamily)